MTGARGSAARVAGGRPVNLSAAPARVAPFTSLATKPNRTDDELRGLVYSITEKQKDVAGAAWYARPFPLGMAVLGATLVLNIIFW